MIQNLFQKPAAHCTLAYPIRTVLLAAASIAIFAANARADRSFFRPGNLVVSRSVYDNNPSNLVPGQVLPPNCTTPPGGCGTAIRDGTYPFVWNNDPVDGSFSITSKIFLDQITPDGSPVNTLEVPNSSQNGVFPSTDQMVTSFSSKSELALNLSLDHQFLTFMGYFAPINALDVSNSNTPAAVDPTNPVPAAVLRVVASVDPTGKFKFTATNAYSGNNGRAAILNNSDGANFFYTAGNAGNGASPQPDGIIIGAGSAIHRAPKHRTGSAKSTRSDPTGELQHYPTWESAGQDWKR